MVQPLLSVVVPAHDEATVITRCLDSVYAGFDPGEVEVVVVANGCTDATADVARAHPRGPQVVELAEGGKPGALNAGDAAVTSFPRAYVDADVRLGPGALRAVLTELDRGALAGAPRPRFETAGRPYVVRAFYDTWQRLPFLTQSPVGNGVYVLSRQGRARFGPFPEITADDLFVLRQFAPHERAVAQDACFVVETPRSLRYLLRVRRRVYAGNAEADAHSPDPGTNPSPARSLLRLVRRPADLPPVAVYALVSVVAKRQAGRRSATRHWERDDSTRATVP